MALAIPSFFSAEEKIVAKHIIYRQVYIVAKHIVLIYRNDKSEFTAQQFGSQGNEFGIIATIFDLQAAFAV